jgi:hypothetical protein
VRNKDMERQTDIIDRSVPYITSPTDTIKTAEYEADIEFIAISHPWSDGRCGAPSTSCSPAPAGGRQNKSLVLKSLLLSKIAQQMLSIKLH